MAIYMRKPKRYEAYRFSGDSAAPGWPAKWLDAPPSFVPMDVPPDFSKPESTEAGKAAVPRKYSGDAPGQVLQIAGVGHIHDVGADDFVLRQPETGEYFSLTAEGFNALFEEVAA